MSDPINLDSRRKGESEDGSMAWSGMTEAEAMKMKDQAFDAFTAAMKQLAANEEGAV